MRHMKTACLLAAAMACGCAEAAMTPEAQLALIKDQPMVWGDAGFQEDFLAGGSFAVTDLDQNGRLEVFFVSRVTEDDEELQKGRRGVIPKRDAPHAALATLPLSHRLRGYEVSADGTRLAPLAVAYTDEEIPPDLTSITATAYNASENIRFYSLDTLNRLGETGYWVYKQVVSLKDGKLTVQNIATEHGQYGIYAEQATPEAVPEGYATRYGEPLSATGFQEYGQTYMAGCAPGKVRIGWLPVEALSEAGDTLDGVLPTFTKSWGLFYYQGK